MRFICTLVLILVVAPKSWADCEPVGADGLIEGKPLIKVAPMYPRRAMRKGVEGCVTLGYGLKKRDARQPDGLVASNVAVLGSTDSHRSSFESAAKKAISKWLFLAKTHSTSDEVAYYSVISFDLVDSE